MIFRDVGDHRQSGWKFSNDRSLSSASITQVADAPIRTFPIARSVFNQDRAPLITVGSRPALATTSQSCRDGVFPRCPSPYTGFPFHRPSQHVGAMDFRQAQPFGGHQSGLSFSTAVL
jgi:hypothetical protein